eukprot:scaffold260326_cov24-Tisochrysis_lutea.AAC.1
MAGADEGQQPNSGRLQPHSHASCLALLMTQPFAGCRLPLTHAITFEISSFILHTDGSSHALAAALLAAAPNPPFCSPLRLLVLCMYVSLRVGNSHVLAVALLAAAPNPPSLSLVCLLSPYTTCLVYVHIPQKRQLPCPCSRSACLCTLPLYPPLTLLALFMHMPLTDSSTHVLAAALLAAAPNLPPTLMMGSACQIFLSASRALIADMDASCVLNPVRRGVDCMSPAVVTAEQCDCSAV